MIAIFPVPEGASPQNVLQSVTSHTKELGAAILAILHQNFADKLILHRDLLRLNLATKEESPARPSYLNIRVPSVSVYVVENPTQVYLKLNPGGWVEDTQKILSSKGFGPGTIPDSAIDLGHICLFEAFRVLPNIEQILQLQPNLELRISRIPKEYQTADFLACLPSIYTKDNIYVY